VLNEVEKTLTAARELTTALETERVLKALPLVPMPIWGTAQRVEEMFGIPKTSLRRLVNEGYVRCRKLFAEKQSRSVFRIADIEEYLEA